MTRLCRPFDKKKVTPASGAWDWVAVPQSILLNGHAFYGDCALLEGTNTATAPRCSVQHQWLPPGRSSVLPFAPSTNPGGCFLRLPADTVEGSGWPGIAMLGVYAWLPRLWKDCLVSFCLYMEVDKVSNAR